MKSFVITIIDEPKSVASAQRCIDSIPNIPTSMWAALTPDDEPFAIAEKEGIKLNFMSEKFSRPDRCLAAFLSHRSLWKYCIDTDEEIQILEHDAVCVNNCPEYINYQGVISLGHPSYGKYNIPGNIGVNPLTSKQYFPGAHAYRVKPRGAKTLYEASFELARPTDVYLNLSNFSWLEEYYPWPFVAKDSFTTIQNRNGCLAKHNYGERYEII